MEIYNIQMKLIKKISYQDLLAGKNDLVIDTDDLAKGTYILKLNIANAQQSYKFVK